MISLSIFSHFVCAVGYLLTINHADGTKTVIPTNGITDIQFVEQTQLTTPSPKVTVTDADALVEWNAVPNAAAYMVSLDGAAESERALTSISFLNLTDGTHSVTVRAIPNADDPTYLPSASATVSFETKRNDTPAWDPNHSWEPGTSGTVYPPGVSATSGFVDVDKVYEGLSEYPSYGSDSELCAGCSMAGILQWWLNDYERVYGKPYPLAIPMEPSRFYTTPIMDEIVQSFKNAAMDNKQVLVWFTQGITNLSQWKVNGQVAFKETSPHAHGGFMGIPWNGDYDASGTPYCPVVDIMKSYECWTSYENGSGRNLTDAQFKVEISKDMIRCLERGPMFLGITSGVGSSSHALTVWGCDYKVDDKGNPIITRLIISENSRGGSNTINGLEFGTGEVGWQRNSYGSPYMSLTLRTLSDGGGKNTKIARFASLPTWEDFEITWPLPSK